MHHTVPHLLRCCSGGRALVGRALCDGPLYAVAGHPGCYIIRMVSLAMPLHVAPGGNPTTAGGDRTGLESQVREAAALGLMWA